MLLSWDDKAKAWKMESEDYPTCAYCKQDIKKTPFHVCELHKKIFCNDCLAKANLAKDNPNYEPVYCHNRRYLNVFTNNRYIGINEIDCMFLQVKMFKLKGGNS